MEKIAAPQNEATRAVEVPPEETTSRNDSSGGWSYRSQSALEVELQQVSEELQHTRGSRTSYRQELEQARQNLAELMERIREAESNELAYRRKVDELTRELEVSRERVRELSAGKT